VLDTSRGWPAAGVRVSLDVRDGDNWTRVADAVTDQNGRVASLLSPAVALQNAAYRLSFEVAGYFGAQGVETFYPEVNVTFEVRNSAEQYHVPLLLSPWGYSTYRGS
jgi:5-hydroxyisourate hydrolase